MKKLFSSTWLLWLWVFSPALSAATLDEILQMDEAPVGVVVEVIETGAAALEAVLKDVQYASGKLRKKFPDLHIAVVSHGKEQFALTRNNIKQHKSLESGVKKLVDDNVELHVCGTHASWYDITPEDYPEYIDVSATGPAQINDYLNVGYVMLDL